MTSNLGNAMCDADDDDQHFFLALPGFAIKCTGPLGWLASRALRAAITRQREFLADARARYLPAAKTA